MLGGSGLPGGSQHRRLPLQRELSAKLTEGAGKLQAFSADNLSSLAFSHGDDFALAGYELGNCYELRLAITPTISPFGAASSPQGEEAFGGGWCSGWRVLPMLGS